MKQTLRNAINERLSDMCIGEHKVNHVFKKDYREANWGDFLRCLGEDYAMFGNGQIVYAEDDTICPIMHMTDELGEIWYPKVDLSKSPLEQTDEVTEKMIDLISNK